MSGWGSYGRGLDVDAIGCLFQVCGCFTCFHRYLCLSEGLGELMCGLCGDSVGFVHLFVGFVSGVHVGKNVGSL